MTVWRAVAALYFTGCRRCDRLRDRWRFLRRGPDNLVDGFSGAERRRALNVGALVIALFDVLRQIAGGAGMRRLFAERTVHHGSSPRAFRSASR